MRGTGLTAHLQNKDPDALIVVIVGRDVERGALPVMHFVHLALITLQNQLHSSVHVEVNPIIHTSLSVP